MGFCHVDVQLPFRVDVEGQQMRMLLVWERVHLE